MPCRILRALVFLMIFGVLEVLGPREAFGQ